MPPKSKESLHIGLNIIFSPPTLPHIRYTSWKVRNFRVLSACQPIIVQNHSNQALRVPSAHLHRNTVFKKKKRKEDFLSNPTERYIPFCSQIHIKVNHSLWFLNTLEWIVYLQNGTIKDLFRFLFSHAMWLLAQTCS